MSRLIDDEEALQDNDLIEVDGLNVAGCELCSYVWNGNFNRNEVICRIFIGRLCKDNLNCYYKQLQRLKKENEQYKQLIEDIKDLCKAHTVNLADLIEAKINEV